MVSGSFFKKFLIVLGVGIVLFVTALVLTQKIVARVSIERGVKIATGLMIQVHDVDIQMLKTSVRIEGIQIFNPVGYPDNVMANIKEFFVDYDLTAFLSKKIHLEDLKIDLVDLLVVRNKEGDLNLNRVAGLQQNQKQFGAIQIDRFTLKVGKVVYKDYTHGQQPLVQTFNVNLDETFLNITDTDTLVKLIAVRALARTALSAFTDLDMNRWRNRFLESLSTTKVLTVDAAGRTKGAILLTSDKAKALWDSSPQIAGKTTEVLKGTTTTITQGVKGLFSSFPFGKKEEEQKQ